ncbi:MAG TPA: methionine adenosyltransferase [Acidobacteriota bacterium]|nr:methionine adenosyltransferase [Acidobacteriota bacterium]
MRAPEIPHRQYRTSEAVTEGHPDKIADQIADAILDEVLRQDPVARVALEVAITGSYVLVAGEVTAAADLAPSRIQDTARAVVADIGYTNRDFGFCAGDCQIDVRLRPQWTEIADAVGIRSEAPRDLKAGDQGIMTGYAVAETAELLPLPIVLAQRLARRQAAVRKERIAPYLRPDGKVQVTIEYEDNRPHRVHTLVISAQHSPDVSREELVGGIRRDIVVPVVPPDLMDEGTQLYINPSGSFVVGGPAADTGLTGRKLLVDTYGCVAAHGGGSLSGKDPTKVDRSGAYAARWAAKNLVASGLCREAEIQIAYAIGVIEPIIVNVTSHGTGRISDEELRQIVLAVYDFRPGMIIEALQLRRPIYRSVSVYGHFGRPDLDLPWERLDKVEEIRKIESDLHQSGTSS